MKLKKVIILISIITFLSGCSLLGFGSPKNPEQELFDEIMTAVNNRAYESSIKACERFLAKYPRSHVKESVMMRMGESFEGLLKRDYQELINKGMDEKKSRASFLAKHGSYNCWELQHEELVYNKKIFHDLLKENPKSFYADEATYNLIHWERGYDQDPARVEKEIKELSDVLTKFPTTSFRPKILFQMGYRFQVLYELYSFSKNPEKRDESKATENFRQAEYLYNLCLQLPEESEYSRNALHNLDALKQGLKIYLK